MENKNAIIELLSTQKNMHDEKSKIKVYPQDCFILIGKSKTNRIIETVLYAAMASLVLFVLILFFTGGITLPHTIKGNLFPYFAPAIILSNFWAISITNRFIIINFLNREFEIRHFGIKTKSYQFREFSGFEITTEKNHTPEFILNFGIGEDTGYSFGKYPKRSRKKTRQLEEMVSLFTMVEKYCKMFKKDDDNVVRTDERKKDQIKKMNELSDEQILKAIQNKENLKPEVFEAIQIVAKQRNLISGS